MTRNWEKIFAVNIFDRGLLYLDYIKVRIQQWAKQPSLKNGQKI